MGWRATARFHWRLDWHAALCEAPALRDSFFAKQMLPRNHGMSTLLGLMEFHQGLRAPPRATDAWLRATPQ